MYGVSSKKKSKILVIVERKTDDNYFIEEFKRPNERKFACHYM